MDRSTRILYVSVSFAIIILGFLILAFTDRLDGNGVRDLVPYLPAAFVAMIVAAILSGWNSPKRKLTAILLPIIFLFPVPYFMWRIHTCPPDTSWSSSLCGLGYAVIAYYGLIPFIISFLIFYPIYRNIRDNIIFARCYLCALLIILVALYIYLVPYTPWR